MSDLGMSDLDRRLQVLADTLNSPAWEDVGERGNPIRSALAASDEVLHELLDDITVMSGGFHEGGEGAHRWDECNNCIVDRLRAVLSERKNVAEKIADAYAADQGAKRVAKPRKEYCYRCGGTHVPEACPATV